MRINDYRIPTIVDDLKDRTRYWEPEEEAEDPKKKVETPIYHMKIMKK